MEENERKSLEQLGRWLIVHSEHLALDQRGGRVKIELFLDEAEPFNELLRLLDEYERLQDEHEGHEEVTS